MISNLILEKKIYTLSLFYGKTLIHGCFRCQSTSLLNYNSMYICMYGLIIIGTKYVYNVYKMNNVYIQYKLMMLLLDRSQPKNDVKI